LGGIEQLTDEDEMGIEIFLAIGLFWLFCFGMSNSERWEYLSAAEEVVETEETDVALKVFVVDFMLFFSSGLTTGNKIGGLIERDTDTEAGDDDEFIFSSFASMFVFIVCPCSC
jgi:hypothetical protein